MVSTTGPVWESASARHQSTGIRVLGCMQLIANVVDVIFVVAQAFCRQGIQAINNECRFERRAFGNRSADNTVQPVRRIVIVVESNPETMQNHRSIKASLEYRLHVAR